MSLFVIVGATGLVGRHVFTTLSQKGYKVLSLTRRSSGHLPKNVVEKVIDFDCFESSEQLPNCQHLFICLGTTIKDAGSQEAFKKVDYTYALSIAKMAKASGAKAVTLISSVGASSQSRSFYLKTKGDLEKAILKLNFVHTHIFRPSIIIGKRVRVRRFEYLMTIVFRLCSIFLVGPLRKYRAIKASKLAESMVLATGNYPGLNYFYSDDFELLCQKNV